MDPATAAITGGLIGGGFALAGAWIQSRANIKTAERKSEEDKKKKSLDRL